jgi:hypothetical protein
LPVDSTFFAPSFPSSAPSFPTFSAAEAVFFAASSVFPFCFLQDSHIEHDSLEAFVLFFILGFGAKFYPTNQHFDAI